jgi:hypothetical protein
MRASFWFDAPEPLPRCSSARRIARRQIFGLKGVIAAHDQLQTEAIP